MSIIEINHVTKEFQLGQLRSLKQTALDGIRHFTGQPVEKSVPFKALDDISFRVEQGEVVGIIGHNGAGKSTLLKLLANISKPTSGTVKVRGKIAPLIEVGAGFIGDLTGRENVFLNAAILGISRAETAKKFDEIVAFSELEEFIDTPVKRYSSGMHVKLAFSVATSIESEILIIDEVLAVGDLAFQRKCFERMENLIKKGGRTVLIVSHNIRQVERICQRAILLDHGRIIDDGPAPGVCNHFYAINDNKVKDQASQLRKVNGTGDVELLSVQLLDDNGLPTDTARFGSQPVFRISLHVNNEIPKPSLVFGFHTLDFFYLWTAVSPIDALPERLPPGDHIISIQMTEFPLINGVFSARLSIDIGDIQKNIFYGENIFHFKVISPTLVRSRPDAEGIIDIPTRWQLT